MTLPKILAVVACLAPAAAWAQTSPDLYYGQVLSAAQWNALFAAKTDWPLKSYTVSTLPTCNSSRVGALYVVTDATSPTYNATLTGGGSTVAMALCNGTTHTAH